MANYNYIARYIESSVSFIRRDFQSISFLVPIFHFQSGKFFEISRISCYQNQSIYFGDRCYLTIHKWWCIAPR